MHRNLFFKSLFILVGIALIFTACTPGAAVDTKGTLAVAAAMQTLTAMPTQTATATPEPSATPEPTATPTPTLTPIPAAVGPSDFPANVDPLTGLTVSDPTILDRRPVMIKVANFPRIGRPHAGLSFADMVFEYYIGEGTNRFLALYYGQDAPQIGPIRSGRLVDAQLVPMYQGILGFEAAYETVYSAIINALGNRAISGSTSTCPAICDDGRGFVYTVFADSAKLTELSTTRGVDNQRYNLDGMRFDTQVPAGGKPAQQVAVQFNVQDRGEWHFDDASGKYLRWIEDVDANNNVIMVPLTDRLTDKQLAFSNVVVLYAYYTEFAPTLHDINMAKNTDGQKAVLFRDGQAFEGTWKSNGADKPMQFFDANGNTLAFKPGNTWIAIMGVNSALTQPKTDDWEYQFYLP